MTSTSQELDNESSPPGGGVGDLARKLLSFREIPIETRAYNSGLQHRVVVATLEILLWFPRFSQIDRQTRVCCEDQRSTEGMRTAILVFVLALISCNSVGAEHAWERPGCTQIGHTRTISIPGCVEFDVTTNACRGFCESYAVPSSEEILRINSLHVIASYGQCCNILESEDVTVNVMCFDGPKRLTFKSATRCGCYHCKKD